MEPLLELLNIIWGRISYLLGVPLQAYGEWAWRNTAYYLLSPEILLVVGILIICVIEVFSKRDNYILASWIGVVFLFVNFLMTVHMMYYTSRYYNVGLGMWWGGLETLDPYAIFFKQLMDWGDILLFIALITYPKIKKYRVEFIIIVLTGTVAFDLMVGSSDILAVYVMTEFGGLCSYILASFYKKDLRSLESGLKYFITGSASTTAMLFAMSILYGSINSTNFYRIREALESGGASLPPVVFSIVLIVVALGYKVGIAPFHLWVADVFEGSPTPVAAFISLFPKVAGYAVLLRLLFIPFLSLKDVWIPAVLIMSILSMIIGNVMALRQTSFKRMMGYSGIAHMGYILIGIVAAAYMTADENNTLGFYAAMYYVLAYFFMNLALFIVQMALEHQGGTDHMDSFNGLIRRNPFLAVLTTILLMALIGLPPTTGFIAKLLVFYSISLFYAYPAALLLIIVAVLTTAVGAYYYMTIAYRMWVLPPTPEQAVPLRPKLFTRIGILVPTLLVLVLGVLYVSVPFDYVKNAWFLTVYSEGTML